MSETWLVVSALMVRDPCDLFLMLVRPTVLPALGDPVIAMYNIIHCTHS